MYDPEAMLRLFRNVMNGEVTNFCVKDVDITAGLTNMTGVYAQEFGPLKVVDYNGAANRCAYLHRYAPIHAAIVSDTVQRLLGDCERAALQFRPEFDVLKICSLGGGPGTDVVGVLAALDAVAGHSREWYTFVSVVDCMQGWESTFRSVVKELRRSKHWRLSSRVIEKWFSWRFLQGDLLDIQRYRVPEAVSNASLVTMVNCLSTFRSKDVQRAIKKIFSAMSSGSFILIIDDAVEELTDITLRTASESQLVPIFGPLRGANYSFDELKVTRFGHTSCHQATVTSLLLMKPKFEPRSFFSLNYQNFIPKFCVKCGNPVNICSKCSHAQGVRNSLYSAFRDLTNSNGASCEPEFKTPVDSRSPSPKKSVETAVGIADNSTSHHLPARCILS